MTDIKDHKWSDDSVEGVQLPNDETVVSMLEHKGKVLVASQKHIYILVEDNNDFKLKRLEFINE